MVEKAVYLKNNYRIAITRINITSIYLIVCYVVEVWHVIKMTSEVEIVLNDDDIFADTVDTQKEGVEQQRKGKCFKDVTYKGKLLSGKKSKET